MPQQCRHDITSLALPTLSLLDILQVPLEELDLRRLREAAEEMREQLGVTSKAVSTCQHSVAAAGAAGADSWRRAVMQLPAHVYCWGKCRRSCSAHC